MRTHRTCKNVATLGLSLLLLAPLRAAAAEESTNAPKSSLEQFLERDYLLGTWGGLRTQLSRHGVDFEFDVIDLNEGRDFLLEDRRYDAVILQFVNRQGYTDKPGFEVTSPKSSWSNWRKRLTATGAGVVFAYGRNSEVSGIFLERLDGGYTRLHLGGIGDLTIFVKEEPMKTSWQEGP